MELQQMRYVVAVAELGSFTRAAKRCLVVQSALSHQIARLEKELGARLFDRTSRRVRLTVAGEVFLPEARQALDAAERARAEVAATAGEVRGRLAVGSIPTVSAVDIPAALRAFHLRHPKVHIVLRDGASKDLAQEVRDGTLDVAFLGVLPSYRPKGVSDHELATGELVAVVSPTHALAGQAEVGLDRLAQELFVDYPDGTAARAQSEEAFAATGLTREVAFEVSGTDFIVRLVRSGLGIAMLPAAFAAELTGVHVLSVRDAPARTERLVWSRFRPTPAAAAFLAGLGVDPGSVAGGGVPSG
ncbi:LysR family transcriptional regulator [Streptomyces sp. NBC_00893]|uniref:LysR family transcriptional regulator n=1 Tax=Streptomyces sp. NBC_00893 TaxID=2975862 RepID=UPI00224F9584|nr:LysR family transcriptional regulator [Streptomyces sp. NBC_00893]MCX4850010.1 LysR family transcriptional regulator [Streptomyces sp. NBC_00893]